jgi:hypothetical protein
LYVEAIAEHCYWHRKRHNSTEHANCCNHATRQSDWVHVTEPNLHVKTEGGVSYSSMGTSLQPVVIVVMTHQAASKMLSMGDGEILPYGSILM